MYDQRSITATGKRGGDHPHEHAEAALASESDGVLARTLTV